MENINFVDLKLQYLSIKKELDEAISAVINEAAFIKGRFVSEFEDMFAKKNNVSHCIGVANGTDAIYIVLKMLGIGSGDEVITTAHSWISTSETISQTGAKPVFIDIDNFFTIDADLIESRITSKTKAIIPVHLYGQPAEMDAIMKIAKKFGLFVIEDCAQAHFAEYHGQKVGAMGNASTFSFFPGKNLGAYGDAGAILTNDDELALKCRMFANHGALIKHSHQIEGINSRLDGLQAAILSVKLKYIDDWNSNRLKNGLYYNALLDSIPNVKTPEIRPDSKHIFHIYCIETDRRDELKNFLNNNGIETQIHYPTMLPILPAYAYLENKSIDFPIAFEKQNKILSLPMYPELTSDKIDSICSSINRFFN